MTHGIISTDRKFQVDAIQGTERANLTILQYHAHARTVCACTCVRISVIHYILSHRTAARAFIIRIETISSLWDKRFDKFPWSLVQNSIRLKEFSRMFVMEDPSLRILDSDSKVITNNLQILVKIYPQSK